MVGMCPSNYKRTWEVAKHPTIAACDPYTSFMLSDLPRTSVIPKMHIYRKSIIIVNGEYEL